MRWRFVRTAIGGKQVVALRLARRGTTMVDLEVRELGTDRNPVDVLRPIMRFVTVLFALSAGLRHCKWAA
jgi:hypothetical protein